MKPANPPHGSTLTLAALVAAASLGAIHATAADIVYQDHFDNDGLGTNAGIGGGAAAVDTTPLDRGPGDWVDNGNLTSTGGNWGGTSANAYSLNGFDLRNGFRLEVTYDIVNVQTRLTIGLIEEDGADQPTLAVIPTSGTLDYHGIFFNPVAYDGQNRFPDAPGLQFSDGINPRQRLSNEQTNGVGGAHTLVLEMDTDSNWSYSVDGAAPTTGTIAGDGFDLNRSYRFVVRNQRSSQANKIQSVTLSTTIDEEPFPLVITPNGPNPGNYDFEWASQPGKIYDLVSDTLLATDPTAWPVWDGRMDIPSGGIATSLSDVPGGGDPERFFAVIEKDPPPVTIFSESFDGTAAGSLPADWTTGKNPADNSSLTNWELGTPANVGPVPPGVPLPSGSNCIATNLSGNYDDPVSDLGVAHTDIWLRSPALDLGAASEGTLVFQQWTQIEDVPGDLDHGSIRILDASDNSELAVMEDRTIDASTTGWEDYSMALPAEAFTAAAGTIKVEWQFEADDIDSFAGWYIDDVAVTVP